MSVYYCLACRQCKKRTKDFFEPDRTTGKQQALDYMKKEFDFISKHIDHELVFTTDSGYQEEYYDFLKE